MPSLAHEALLTLFEHRPELAADLLRAHEAVAVPEYGAVRCEPNDLAQMSPTEYRADQVVMLLSEDRPVYGVVVEIQLRVDARKKRSWPVYATVLRSRHNCPVAVLVVAPDALVARWADRPIPLGGPPDCVFRPVVVGPEHIPVITDPAVARAAPELAMLSARVHGHGERGLAVALAALEATQATDDERAVLYWDLIHLWVGETVRRQLEQLMERGTYQYQSDFARKYFGQGLAEGKAKGLAEGEAKGLAEGEAKGLAEGEAKGRAEALFRVAVARGLWLSDDQRAIVLACRDLETLDRWIDRALSAASVDEILA